ncbi:hypothetical protein ACOACO_07625 [Nocardioides sp. CPCC 205120]|uniref:hypothetical protein n=1 Tax=Nocardioides sp. CPCC 205120 TaxID=3406462 RepID=UPI003B50FBAA
MAWSRIHDLVAVTVPLDCVDPEDPTGGLAVLSQLHLSQVTADGARETSRSYRLYSDLVMTI